MQENMPTQAHDFNMNKKLQQQSRDIQHLQKCWKEDKMIIEKLREEIAALQRQLREAVKYRKRKDSYDANHEEGDTEPTTSARGEVESRSDEEEVDYDEKKKKKKYMTPERRS